MANAATDPLAGRIIGGLLLQMIGTYVILNEPNDRDAVLIGWLVTGLGSIFFFIGVIGWGVLAGLRAHARERDGT